jgi:hypothetical protein
MFMVVVMDGHIEPRVRGDGDAETERSSGGRAPR